MFDLAIDGSIARLNLTRPAARNAIPAAEWPRLGDRAEAAVAGGARVLVAEGAGGAFCAGADISDFAAMQGDNAAAASFRRAMRDGIERLAAIPIPSVALIEGPCYGAGVALAMACDLRAAAPGATFAITPAKFGISYPQEDVARLVALAGPGQASRLLFSGAAIDAEEALRIGLVEILAPAPEDLLASLSANSGASIAALKSGIRRAAEGTRQDEAQDRLFDDLLASEELSRRLKRRKER